MTGTGSETHPAQLAHHFDTPAQQFEASKLGMWLFLATEVLMFGGLFGAYAVFRALHPEIFAYGSQFLDTTWGAINTVVLILSSLTMALAVWCAQIGHRHGLMVFLGFTLLFAVNFLVIKYIEYSHKFHEHLLWGLEFYEGRKEPEAAGAAPVEDDATRQARADKIWTNTCRTCHGAEGEGVSGQGKELRGSSFVKGLDDAGLLAFLKKGRSVLDGANTTGIMMPPKGGNPLLMDRDLTSLLPMLRTIASTPGTVVDSAPPEPAAGEGYAMAPMSVIPPPPEPVWAQLELATAGDLKPGKLLVERPANAHIFFGIYFCMTGLHGIHVLGGVILLSILLVLAARGHFGASYFTPVELGGLYWHIVDIIWIFLFPLLYLIG